MTISFTPGKIGNIEIKNRFVKASTTEGLALDNGEVTEDLINYYEQYARFDLGLILMGHMYVQPKGKAHGKQTAIFDDAFIPGLKRIVEAAHSNDAKIFAQLSHGGSQVTDNGAESVGPSPVKNLHTGVIPRELKADEINEIIAAFGESARRAAEAGFDGIHLHASHGYLISQFNSPYGNRREDEWGGTPEKRARFLLKVVKEIRTQVGPDYPLTAKLGIEDAVDDGLKREEGAELARVAAEAGIQAIEVSAGVVAPGGSMWRVKRVEDEAYFLPYAKLVRKTMQNLPLILVGGLKTPAVMEKAIQEGDVDFVSMARPLIREPDFVHQVAKGRSEKASCVSCNKCVSGLGIRRTRCYVEEPLTEEEKSQQ